MNRKKSYCVTAALCVFTVALLMLNWWLAVLNQDPGKNPVSFDRALAMSIGFTGVLVLSVTLVHRYAPSRVMIQRDWLRWSRANSFRSFKYADIESYSMDWKTIDGQDFPVLSLTTKKKKAFTCGIDSSVDMHELEKILSERMSRAKCEKTEHNSIDVNPNF